MRPERWPIDEQSFSDFASAHWMTLVRSAALLGCSVHEAEDLAQTTLLRCHLSWSKVEAAENRNAYVSRILLNTLRASRRRRWWGERPSSRLPDSVTPDRADDVAAELTIQAALCRLSQGQREVVVLRYFVMLTEQQIAETLAIAPGTVKSRLSRALAVLAHDPDLDELRPGRTT
jgi:RNA polymerase sigma-70 factor (sigma-E family)